MLKCRLTSLLPANYCELSPISYCPGLPGATIVGNPLVTGQWILIPFLISCTRCPWEVVGNFLGRQEKRPIALAHRAPAQIS